MISIAQSTDFYSYRPNNFYHPIARFLSPNRPLTGNLCTSTGIGGGWNKALQLFILGIVGKILLSFGYCPPLSCRNGTNSYEFPEFTVQLKHHPMGFKSPMSCILWGEAFDCFVSGLKLFGRPAPHLTHNFVFRNF